MMACAESPGPPSIGLTRVWPVSAIDLSHAESIRPSTLASGGRAQACTCPLVSAINALLNNRSRPPTSGKSTSVVAVGSSARMLGWRDAVTAMASAASRMRFTYTTTVAAIVLVSAASWRTCSLYVR